MIRKIEEILKKFLTPAGDYIYGFADLTGLLDRKFTGYNYGISIGKKLDSTIVDKVINGPTPEYYTHYCQVNDDLAALTEKIAVELSAFDIETYRIEPTVSTSDLDSVYYNTLRTDLSHKMVATRAGLGWIGKTDLFISRDFGPRLRLVSMLIKVQVRPKQKPIDISKCGLCTICVDICPAKAANGKLWDITTEREEFFDAFLCRRQCAEFGEKRLGKDARICGICVSACPIGRNIR